MGIGCGRGCGCGSVGGYGCVCARGCVGVCMCRESWGRKQCIQKRATSEQQSRDARVAAAAAAGARVG